MNLVLLSGHIVRDPEVRYTPAQMAIARFTIACNRRTKGDAEHSADYVNCTAFGNTAEFIEKYFHKSDGIEIKGKITTSSYTNNENKKIYTMEVTVDTVEFPKGKKQASTHNEGFTPAEDTTDIPEGFQSVDGLPF